MKILHTSDWHLGRMFGAVHLDDDQRAFLEWLVQFVAEQKVELVVIAGDIYDRAIPRPESIPLFRNALNGMRAAGAQVVAITGNHDGADRVASYGELLDLSGIYIRGGYAAIGDVIRLNFADGPLDVVPLPYLDPQLAPGEMPADEIAPTDPAIVSAPSAPTDNDVPANVPRAGSLPAATPSTEAAYQRRLRRTHGSVLEAAIGAAKPNLSSPRTLAIAHAFVGGATTSDSERTLSIGGTDQVSADLFDEFSYTALGHLHRPQYVGGRSSLRYSGTPLAYSFSENHEKSITLLEMASDGTLVAIDEVAVPVGRSVLTVTGRIGSLLAATPTDKERASFVRAVITDSTAVLDAKPRLSALYPHVVEIEMKPQAEDGTPVVAAGAPTNRGQLRPEQLVEMFWEDSVKQSPKDAERELLHAALTAAARSTAAKEA